MSVKRGDPEHQIQVAFVARCNMQLQKYPALRLAYAVPNGGLRHKATAGKLKAEGVRPAVPDWKLPVPNLDYTGLAIEFKAPGKYPPPEQRQYHELLRACFWRVEVSRDPEHAWGIVEDYMSRMDTECLGNIIRVLGEGRS